MRVRAFFLPSLFFPFSSLARLTVSESENLFFSSPFFSPFFPFPTACAKRTLPDWLFDKYHALFPPLLLPLFLSRGGDRRTRRIAPDKHSSSLFPPFFLSPPLSRVWPTKKKGIRSHQRPVTDSRKSSPRRYLPFLFKACRPSSLTASFPPPPPPLSGKFRRINVFIDEPYFFPFLPFFPPSPLPRSIRLRQLLGTRSTS